MRKRPSDFKHESHARNSAIMRLSAALTPRIHPHYLPEDPKEIYILLLAVGVYGPKSHLGARGQWGRKEQQRYEGQTINEDSSEVRNWGLVAIIGPRPDKIRVILRRVGNGNITFFSVTCGSKILPDRRQRLAPENLS